MCVCATASAVGGLAGCNNVGPDGGNGGGGQKPVIEDIKFDELGKPIFSEEDDGKGITLKVWSVIGAPDNTYLNVVNKAFNDANKYNGVQAELTSITTV